MFNFPEFMSSRFSPSQAPKNDSISNSGNQEGKEQPQHSHFHEFMSSRFSPSQARSTMRRGIAALGMAAIFVLTLELCARVDDWVRWDAPILGHYSQALLTVTDQHGRHSRPGARFQKWQINSHGFRGPEITLEKPAGVVRVVVAGASEAFGLHESPGMEFPAQLQTLLDSKAPGRYQVLNAACPGMTPARIAKYFDSWVTRFEPDVLVFYPTPAFYLDINPPPDPPLPEFMSSRFSTDPASKRDAISNSGNQEGNEQSQHCPFHEFMSSRFSPAPAPGRDAISNSGNQEGNEQPQHSPFHEFMSSRFSTDPAPGRDAISNSGNQEGNEQPQHSPIPEFMSSRFSPDPAPGRDAISNSGNQEGNEQPQHCPFHEFMSSRFSPSQAIPSLREFVRARLVALRSWRPSLRLAGKIQVVRRRVLPQRIQTWARLWSIRRSVSRHPPDWVWTSPPPERLDLFRRHVLALIALAEHHGARVILATHGTRFGATLSEADHSHLIAWRKFYPRAGDRTLIAMDQAANALIRDLGEKYALPVADVTSAVPPAYYADFAHFTDEGARLAARMVVNCVKQLPANSWAQQPQ
jgi:hypothetical protein